MKIYDLTRSKYPQMYDGSDILSQYEDQFKMAVHGSDSFQQLFQKREYSRDVEALIDPVPIFLVETSMANEYVAVPGTQCSIHVPTDPTEAVRWFRKAAEQNLDMAQCNIGDCYKDGMGVDKNNREAIKWYRKAADQGSTYASDALEDLEELSFGMKVDWFISLLPCILAWGSSFVLGRSWSIGIFFMLFMAALIFFFQGFLSQHEQNGQQPTSYLYNSIYIASFKLWCCIPFIK